MRGVGLIESTADIENIVIGAANGTPIYVRNVAAVKIGDAFRVGALDRDGKEAIGGVVIARYGVNALDVIEGVKEKLKSLESGLPNRREDHAVLRPYRADPARYRDAQTRADRRAAARHARAHRLPLPLPLDPDRHDSAAARSARFVSVHALPRHQLEPDVAGGNRDCNRRAGRRRHRRHRKRFPADGKERRSIRAIATGSGGQCSNRRDS